MLARRQRKPVCSLGGKARNSHLNFFVDLLPSPTPVTCKFKGQRHGFGPLGKRQEGKVRGRRGSGEGRGGRSGQVAARALPEGGPGLRSPAGLSAPHFKCGDGSSSEATTRIQKPNFASSAGQDMQPTWPVLGAGRCSRPPRGPQPLPCAAERGRPLRQGGRGWNSWRLSAQAPPSPAWMLSQSTKAKKIKNKK